MEKIGVNGVELEKEQRYRNLTVWKAALTAFNQMNGSLNGV